MDDFLRFAIRYGPLVTRTILHYNKSWIRQQDLADATDKVLDFVYRDLSILHNPINLDAPIWREHTAEVAKDAAIYLWRDHRAGGRT